MQLSKEEYAGVFFGANWKFRPSGNLLPCDWIFNQHLTTIKDSYYLQNLPNMHFTAIFDKTIPVPMLNA